MKAIPVSFVRQRMAYALYRRDIRRLVRPLVVLLLTGLPAAAGALEAADLEAFGRLPVRFNGRVTTWSRMSSAYLLQISGRDFYLDEQGERQPPIRWVLAHAAGAKDAGTAPIFPIGEGGLIERLKLRDRPKDAAGLRYYSAADLAPIAAQIELLGREAQRKFGHDRGPVDLATLDLGRRMMTFMALESGFVSGVRMTPAGADETSVQREREELRRAERNNLPLVVPPQEESAPWRTFRSALLETLSQRGQVEPGRPIPHVLRLYEVFRAFRDGRDAQFTIAVTAFADMLKNLRFEVQSSPMTYNVPDGWVEMGAPPSDELHRYDDTRSPGHCACTFETRTTLPGMAPSEVCFARIDHFPESSASFPEIANCWRFNQRLMPLPLKQIPFTEGKVGVLDAWMVEIAGVAGPRREHAERSISALVRRGDHLFVFSLYGPDEAVARQKDSFNRWLSSTHLGEPEALTRWFATTEPPAAPPMQMLGAIVPAGNTVWCAFMVGDAKVITPLEDAFSTFARSLRPAAGNPDAPGITWKLPDAWEAIELEGRAVSRIITKGGDGATANIEVRALSRERGQSDLLPLVNLLRERVDARPVTDAEGIGAVAERIEVDGQAGWLLNARSPQK